jgi:small conductance mechanosensitive channel
VIDSALKRLHLLAPPGERAGGIRVEQRAETLRQVVRSVGKVVVAVILGLTISSELGFPLGLLLASVGIASLAIGFGAQSLVKDIISGGN